MEALGNLSGIQIVSIFKILLAVITFLTINGCPRSLSEDAGLAI